MIVLSTHQADDIAAICPQVIVLLQGRVHFAGTPAELAATATGRVWAADERDPDAHCPGAAATTGGGTSASTGRGAELVTPTVEEATCCCPTRQVPGDRSRRRTAAGARPPDPAGAGGRYVSPRSRSPRLRTVLALARVEAWLLVRSLLVLAGLLAGGAMAWALIRRGSRCGGTPPGGSAAGSSSWPCRPGRRTTGRRAAPQGRHGDLYASFPATTATRTLAHLAGLAGAVPASLLLVGAAAALVQVRGAIGTPSHGADRRAAAGDRRRSDGVAIGTRFPHPLAGVLGAMVLLLSSRTSTRPPGGHLAGPLGVDADQLGWLPGPLAGYPPAGAHVLELAGSPSWPGSSRWR